MHRNIQGNFYLSLAAQLLELFDNKGQLVLRVNIDTPKGPFNFFRSISKHCTHCRVAAIKYLFLDVCEKNTVCTAFLKIVRNLCSALQ